MNHTSECGSLGIANRIRRSVGLEQLSEYTGNKVERRERRGKDVTMNEHFKNPKQKQAITDSQYAKKSSTSDHTAKVGQSFDRRTRENIFKPFGYGTLGLAAVRATLYEDPVETAGGIGGEGQTVTPKMQDAGSGEEGATPK